MALFYRRLRPEEVSVIYAPWINNRAQTAFSKPYGLASHKFMLPRNILSNEAYKVTRSLRDRVTRSTFALISNTVMTDLASTYFLSENHFVAPPDGIASTMALVGPSERFDGLPPSVPAGVPVVDGRYVTHTAEAVVVVNENRWTRSDIGAEYSAESIGADVSILNMLGPMLVFLEDFELLYARADRSSAISAYAYPMLAAFDALILQMRRDPDLFWAPMEEFIDGVRRDESGGREFGDRLSAAIAEYKDDKDMAPYFHLLIDLYAGITAEKTALKKLLQSELDPEKSLAANLTARAVHVRDSLVTLMIDGYKLKHYIISHTRLLHLRTSIIALLDTINPREILSATKTPLSEGERTLFLWTPGVLSMATTAFYTGHLQTPAVRNDIAARILEAAYRSFEDDPLRAREYASVLTDKLLTYMTKDPIAVYGKVAPPRSSGYSQGTVYRSRLYRNVVRSIPAQDFVKDRMRDVMNDIYRDYHPFRTYIETSRVRAFYEDMYDHHERDHRRTAATIFASSVSYAPSIELRDGTRVDLTADVVVDFHVPTPVTHERIEALVNSSIDTRYARQVHVDLIYRTMVAPQVRGVVRELERAVRHFKASQGVHVSFTAKANMNTVPYELIKDLMDSLITVIPSARWVDGRTFAFSASSVPPAVVAAVAAPADDALDWLTTSASMQWLADMYEEDTASVEDEDDNIFLLQQNMWVAEAVQGEGDTVVLSDTDEDDDDLANMWVAEAVQGEGDTVVLSDTGGEDQYIWASADSAVLSYAAPPAQSPLRGDGITVDLVDSDVDMVDAANVSEALYEIMDDSILAVDYAYAASQEVPLYTDAASLQAHLDAVLRDDRTGERIYPNFDSRRGIYSIVDLAPQERPDTPPVGVSTPRIAELVDELMAQFERTDMPMPTTEEDEDEPSSDDMSFLSRPAETALMDEFSSGELSSLGQPMMMVDELSSGDMSVLGQPIAASSVELRPSLAPSDYRVTSSSSPLATNESLDGFVDDWVESKSSPLSTSSPLATNESLDDFADDWVASTPSTIIRKPPPLFEVVKQKTDGVASPLIAVMSLDSSGMPSTDFFADAPLLDHASHSPENWLADFMEQ